jgi:hypothetical protein
MMENGEFFFLPLENAMHAATVEIILSYVMIA